MKNLMPLFLVAQGQGAFRCIDWDKYLDNDSKSFHFDGSGEGLWNIHKKVKFLDEMGDSIKHALVVMSHETLKKTYPRYGHLFVEDPRISKESWITFYYQFQSTLQLEVYSFYNRIIQFLKLIENI